MPSYTYINIETKEIKTDVMSLTEWESLLKDNPHLQWYPTSGIATVDAHRLGRMKPDDGFRDLLRTIKKGSPGSTIDTY